MSYLIKEICQNCGRTYRYQSDAEPNEKLCPHPDCWNCTPEEESDFQ